MLEFVGFFFAELYIQIRITNKSSIIGNITTHQQFQTICMLSGALVFNQRDFQIQDSKDV